MATQTQMPNFPANLIKLMCKW